MLIKTTKSHYFKNKNTSRVREKQQENNVESAWHKEMEEDDNKTVGMVECMLFKIKRELQVKRIKNDDLNICPKIQWLLDTLEEILGEFYGGSVETLLGD